MTVQIDIQTIECPEKYEKQQFAFLSKPPPPSKRRPNPFPPPPGSPPPVPTIRPTRSNTYSGILTWASLVQPGSPGSPPVPGSPHRRPSISSNTSRRPSISRLGRRPSITHGRIPSGSFIIVDTPTRSQHTPSVGDFDLTTLGYTSVFVHLPKTPTTPSPYLRQYQLRREQQRSGGAPATNPLSAGPQSASAFAHIPIPPIPTEDATPKRKGMKRFRSLSILRPRGSRSKSQAGPSSPTVSTKSSKPLKTTKKQSPALDEAAITKSKQAKYAHVRPPPPLANDLALMQFADGGSMESNVKRVMQAQAKAAKGSGPSVGVGDVYRDGKGGIWWDADEEMEYAPLLRGKTAQEAMKEDQDADVVVNMEWEAFGSANPSPLAQYSHPAVVKDSTNPVVRRTSVSTQDSDLDPKYLLPLPENEDPRSMAVDDRVLTSRKIGGAGMSVLSLPCRPRRAAPHLCKPVFLTDVAAFGPRSPKSPRSPVFSAVAARTPTTFAFSGACAKPRGKARRRPAPLKLANSAHAAAVKIRCSPRTPRSAAHEVPSPIRRVAAALVPDVIVPSPGGVDKTRREFMEDSFAPSPLPPSSRNILQDVPAPMVNASSGVKALRRGGVRALFSIAKRSETD